MVSPLVLKMSDKNIDLYPRRNYNVSIRSILDFLKKILSRRYNIYLDVYKQICHFFQNILFFLIVEKLNLSKY